jgi:hypothetical protein
MEFGYGSHAAENHRCIEERIKPGKPFKSVITNHADAQSYEHKHQPNNNMSDNSKHELSYRQQRLRTVFKHWKSCHFKILLAVLRSGRSRSIKKLYSFFPAQRCGEVFNYHHFIASSISLITFSIGVARKILLFGSQQLCIPKSL